jgi:ABC-type phosphate/phosphonate transport system permease subunit
MNISLLIANLLCLLAFFAHAFVGDKEIRFIAPEADPENDCICQEKWTMARCGWHWVSFDLLFANIGLALINFTDILNAEKTLLQVLAVYFLGYAIAWFVTIVISKSFPKNYLKLGQWVLLLCLSGLVYWGSLDF